MSDHDTSDAALVERLRNASVYIHRDTGVIGLLQDSADALARRIAEGERLKTALHGAEVWMTALAAQFAEVADSELFGQLFGEALLKVRAALVAEESGDPNGTT